MANTDAPTSSTAGAGGVGNSAQDEKRRSSPMFASLQQYKRESNPEAFKARQETLNESKPAEML
ncbi:hypothetical protein B0A50_05049 [Salinomyces thailandicus]|uniref:Uncharacterized protein n=1 Tax=Salinomyces thailandicus TaxID=706561 RepID=A0A4U0TVB6_9PEZI|nr:hypothetical protein B0A50_05049 [Salinomyces thailandica]